MSYKSFVSPLTLSESNKTKLFQWAKEHHMPSEPGIAFEKWLDALQGVDRCLKAKALELSRNWNGAKPTTLSHRLVPAEARLGVLGLFVLSIAAILSVVDATVQGTSLVQVEDLGQDQGSTNINEVNNITDETLSNDKNQLVALRDSLNKIWNKKTWYGWIDPKDDLRLNENAEYAKKLMKHVENVHSVINGVDKVKLTKYMSPIYEAISRDLINQTLTTDHSFMNATLTKALDGNGNSVQEERMGKIIALYQPFVDTRTKSGFTNTYVHEVVDSLTPNNIVSWYDKNIVRETPEKLFRKYTQDYVVDMLHELNKLDVEELDDIKVEVMYKLVIMNVAISEQKIKADAESGRYDVSSTSKNKYEEAILAKWNEVLNERDGIKMTETMTNQLIVFGLNGKSDRRKEIVSDVELLWKLQNERMSEDLKEADKQRIRQQNNMFINQFTAPLKERIAELAGQNYYPNKLMDIFEENFSLILAGAVIVSSLFVKNAFSCGMCGICHSCSRQPTSQMDSQPTPQMDDTPRPRRRTITRNRTTPRMALGYGKQVVNKKVYILKSRRDKNDVEPDKYWIKDGNVYRRITLNSDKWVTLRKTLQTQNIDKKTRQLIGRIDENGILQES